ncbi:MAG: pyrimidine 5'-nucleotidase [Pseudomonadota bacterium]
MADFTHVEDWIFDLDNTLYPADCNLFAQIDHRMRTFIEERFDLAPADARTLQKRYYVEYGTTLAGLMKLHGCAPHDFMDYVHDIDLSPVDEHPELARRIADLPGRKHIFTNGSVKHAENVCAKLGLADHFETIFDIEAADFLPKPHRQTYERFVSRHGVEAPRAAMFEDIAVNLEAPHQLGMTTVLITSTAPWIEDEPVEKRPAASAADHAHVHHATDDLYRFLTAVRTAAA